MSSSMHAASSLMSPTSSFSVLSSVETRSRSSTLSYQNLDAGDGSASLSQSFSELSSNVSGGAPHTALSQNVSEDEDGDEFILIPAGSNILNSVAQPQALAFAGLESTSRIATPFVSHRHAAESADENDAEDEGEDNSSSTDDDEEEARATQRSLRAGGWADGSDSGSEDDAVLATTDGMRNLSLDLQMARAPSALSVQTLTYPVTATPVPPRHAPLAPSAPAVPAQTTKVTSKPNLTQAQIEQRKLKKQRAKARKEKKKARKEKKKALERQQSLSDSGSSTTGAGHSSDGSVGNSAYDDAVAFITKYLAKPPQQPSAADRLRLLQSLIIELGLLSGKAKMPQSATAAKKLIKQHVHINVKDYLTRRTKLVEVPQTGPATSTTGNKASIQVGVGVTELKKLMFPSKSALQMSLGSNKKNTMPREAIKKAGLNAFMVVVFG
ncbi:hypothetical protein FRC04_011652 [Tulasnella sp. 424]|nr:hypothetical protein FRC04_011652 [Tulasnella sp. 424]KAG8971469.1 hypothetical protein FRC05_011042 [Tulasnella sp. 425]